MADKKVALITGANKGIGKEIARQLGALGMTVLIGARDKRLRRLFRHQSLCAAVAAL